MVELTSGGVYLACLLYTSRISYLSENPLGTWTESLIRLTLDGSRGPFVPPYQLFIRKSPGIRTESWIRLTPVSYTHLDVYKRQNQMRSLPAKWHY